MTKSVFAVIFVMASLAVGVTSVELEVDAAGKAVQLAKAVPMQPDDAAKTPSKLFRKEKNVEAEVQPDGGARVTRSWAGKGMTRKVAKASPEAEVPSLPKQGSKGIGSRPAGFKKGFSFAGSKGKGCKDRLPRMCEKRKAKCDSKRKWLTKMCPKTCGVCKEEEEDEEEEKEAEEQEAEAGGRVGALRKKIAGLKDKIGWDRKEVQQDKDDEDEVEKSVEEAEKQRDQAKDNMQKMQWGVTADKAKKKLADYKDKVAKAQKQEEEDENEEKEAEKEEEQEKEARKAARDQKWAFGKKLAESKERRAQAAEEAKAAAGEQEVEPALQEEVEGE